LSKLSFSWLNISLVILIYVFTQYIYIY
jgi:hypothetical protein